MSMSTYNLPINMEVEMDALEQSENYRLIEKAIRFIELHARQQPDLDEIAAAVGMSESHFQRTFTRWAGISPKRFLQFLTKENAKSLLAESENLLETTHRIGLSSLGRLHDLFVVSEAVTPGEYKSRGAGVTIRYGLHPTPLGACLIGATERGICHLGFVESSEGAAIDNLVADWAHARMLEDYEATAPFAARIFSAPGPGAPLPVHLRGTNFQLKVWEALLQIPSGALTTYERLALQIGRPTASRAVGGAVGANPIAVLIPCHRVIRKEGVFGNYRYGSARKKALLAREFANSGIQS